MKAVWLFDRRLDLSVFLGSFALSGAALVVGALTGALHDETPTWAWVPAIVLCDVAHVWATLFRTYLHPAERRARARLFGLVPVLALAGSVALYALGKMTFWRALAYLAIFHFVRQQYGWVALYRARAGERGRVGRLVDTAAIYAATLYPLLYWHTHLPRRFSWFVAGDVVALPGWIATAASWGWALALGAYAIRTASMWARGTPNPGKDIVVATTAVAWYVGIVAFDSDYAFTVTNVFMHGIPYLALVFVQSRREPERPAHVRGTSLGRLLTRNALVFIAALWVVAFFEELVWDRAVWHDRSWLFGDPWEAEPWELALVPLLALPQLTHYVLDGFIWKRRSNASLAALAAASPASAQSGDAPGRPQTAELPHFERPLGGTRPARDAATSCRERAP